MEPSKADMTLETFENEGLLQYIEAIETIDAEFLKLKEVTDNYLYQF